MTIKTYTSGLIIINKAGVQTSFNGYTLKEALTIFLSNLTLG